MQRASPYSTVMRKSEAQRMVNDDPKLNSYAARISPIFFQEQKQSCPDYLRYLKKH